MRTATVISVAATVIASLLSGCGSSSKTSSTATSAASATTQAASAPTPAPVVITTKQTKLGTILGAGPKRLTVYLFEGDKGATSSCSGACATAWPPVIGKPQASGSTRPAALGTITRADGTTQVTYSGHPLYFFVKDVNDGDPGDAYGEAVKAFGADWYVLAPSGKKIDKS
jgi:predicted lipoprotein with Yx(FWY)xxD motif